MYPVRFNLEAAEDALVDYKRVLDAFQWDSTEQGGDFWTSFYQGKNQEEGRKILQEWVDLYKSGVRPMHLEVGKRYVTESGEVTFPLQNWYGEYRDPITGYTYNLHGYGGRSNLKEVYTGDPDLNTYVDTISGERLWVQSNSSGRVSYYSSGYVLHRWDGPASVSNDFSESYVYGQYVERQTYKEIKPFVLECGMVAECLCFEYGRFLMNVSGKTSQEVTTTHPLSQKFDCGHYTPSKGGRATKQFFRDIMPRLACYPYLTQDVLAFYAPLSNEDELTIGVYVNGKDKERDRRTWMKPGRAIRMMFPHLNDSALERIVDQYKVQFTPAKYTLHKSTEAEGFAYAYSHTQAPYHNVYTTDSRKSSANSCMRYAFEELPCHPVEAYASGEFMILYTTLDGTDKIGSRCVVWMKHESGTPQAGPIYGVDESSLDKIQEELNSMGATNYYDADWVGAKLVATPHENGGWVAPYLDVEPRSLKVEGDYLVVSERGNISAADYEGVLGAGTNYNYCTVCDESLHPDDTFADNHGNHYCEVCYHERYFDCYFEGEVSYEDSDEHTAYVLSWHNTAYAHTVCENALENCCVYVKSLDQFWKTEDCRYLEYRDEYVPRTVDTLRWSEELRDWLREEDAVETDTGDYILKDLEGWEENDQGLYFKVAA